MQNIDGKQLPEAGFHITKITRKGYESEAAMAVINYAAQQFNF